MCSMPVTRNRTRHPSTALGLITGALLTGLTVVGCGQDGPSPKPVTFMPVSRVAEKERCDGERLRHVRAPRGDDCLVLTNEGQLADVMVESAKVSRAAAGPGWTVDIDLAEKDAKAFAELSETAASESRWTRRIAVLIDGELVSAPTVRSRIDSGNLRLSVFDKERAEELVTDLTGEEPETKPSRTRTVEPWAPPTDPY